LPHDEPIPIESDGVYEIEFVKSIPVRLMIRVTGLSGSLKNGHDSSLIGDTLPLTLPLDDNEDDEESHVAPQKAKSGYEYFNNTKKAQVEEERITDDEGETGMDGLVGKRIANKYAGKMMADEFSEESDDDILYAFADAETLERRRNMDFILGRILERGLVDSDEEIEVKEENTRDKKDVGRIKVKREEKSSIKSTKTPNAKSGRRTTAYGLYAKAYRHKVRREVCVLTYSILIGFIVIE
jgi:hypothetical protein